MSKKYILEGKEPVRCYDVIAWGEFFEVDSNRRVAQTSIGEASVSTVFLGLDHQFVDGPPLLFETMVFGGSLDQEMDRYSTWKEAEAGHESMVAKVKDTTTMRTKGKVDDETFLDLTVVVNSDDAHHLVACWNAVESIGGDPATVGKMRGLLAGILEMGVIKSTDFAWDQAFTAWIWEVEAILDKTKVEL